MLKLLLIKTERRKERRASLRQEFLVTPTGEADPTLALYWETGVSSRDKLLFVAFKLTIFPFNFTTRLVNSLVAYRWNTRKLKRNSRQMTRIVC